METILFNEAMNALAVPDRGIPNYAKSKIAEHTRRHLQMEMIAAQRFVLDDNMTRHCSEASFDTPANLLKFAQRAIPPFESIFIEWDERVRVSKNIETGIKKYGESYPETDKDMEGVGGRLGYLIRRINDRISYSAVFTIDGEKADTVYFMPYGFYFDVDGTITFEDSQHPTLDNGIRFKSVGESQKHFDQQQTGTSVAVLGSNWVLQNYGYQLEEMKQNQNRRKALTDIADDFSFQWFKSRIMDCETMLGLYMDDESYRSGFDSNDPKHSEFVIDNLKMMDGDLRFLICALGFLNYDRIVTELVQPDRKIQKRKYGRIIPQNEYRVVSIDLPKRATTLRRGILTGTGTPKKEHMVRGHPRRMPSGKVIWISPHKRGNSDYGIIYHDYHMRGTG